MDIRVSGHQIDTGSALQEHVDDRLNSIVDKYFNRAISSHVTFGKGRNFQLSLKLKHNPLCKPDCPAYKKSGIHKPSCEHGIIKAAQKAAGCYTH